MGLSRARVHTHIRCRHDDYRRPMFIALITIYKINK